MDRFRDPDRDPEWRGDDERYEGNENATRVNVRRYLASNYYEDNEPLSEVRLTALMTEHANWIDQGIAIRSHAYYVGDRIAELSGLSEFTD